ncbi:uncharacterized protein LOC132699084 isoform X2 [Cylas formicarius]|uniref:uncharacterized protein LOC132699084 isoform X2 n=1 Tax=Cylas formicarius TaxID=197179 RepID=UPI00295892FB|nr:uncharacterized protein LOC132699084 isoform X2 [Cylas formicarius]
MAEFLPLCDLVFNIVSLAAYFCDLVFHVLVVYALYERGIKVIFAQCIGAIFLALLVSQVLSLRWYFLNKPTGWSRMLVITIHLMQMGVLWRYARLLIPVQIATVKKDVRDLCILRLIHGFVEAAPMLLLQLHLLPSGSASTSMPSDLVKVSTSLSLFSVCWALASFSKHVQTVDRLVLTWLGVMSQLLWRIGTVSSRTLALWVYAATYSSWIYLVLALHWSCMFLWLVSPRSPFHGQRGSKLGDKSHSRTMTIFYVVMLLENCLLVGASLAATWQTKPEHIELVAILTVALFAAGIGFMLLYYRYFHVRRLIEKPAPGRNGSCGLPSGVFNCRFGGVTGIGPAAAAALYRKKKKPTTFIPPPTGTGGTQIQVGPVTVPFWRRPLPSSSENEGSSVGSRVNIHQKLQEKKQKQLAELKIIEEEIKQGKLVGPEGADFDDRQPIPRTKKHVEPQLLSLASLNNLASYGFNLNRRPPPRAPRNRTPEVLLTPHYLYCNCVAGGGIGSGGQEQAKSSEIPGDDGVISYHSVGSDLESQISLPRSYTLPREFKYYRRPRAARPIRTITSTNSSDGDVDSAGEESDSNPPPVIIRQLRRPFRHETKL